MLAKPFISAYALSIKFICYPLTNQLLLSSLFSSLRCRGFQQFGLLCNPGKPLFFFLGHPSHSFFVLRFL